jgi:hypothetical protein
MHAQYPAVALGRIACALCMQVKCSKFIGLWTLAQTKDRSWTPDLSNAYLLKAMASVVVIDEPVAMNRDRLAGASQESAPPHPKQSKPWLLALVLNTR